MYRKAIQKLLSWKKDIQDNNYPLILTGARQVGKTWLLKSFGEEYFKKTLYINFENDTDLSTTLKNTSGSLAVKDLLEKKFNTPITEDTLVIFDEVQLCKEVFARIKYFTEDILDFHIITAGSLMGIALHKGTSYPSNADTYRIFPLDFEEFLIALDKKDLVDTIKGLQPISSSDHAHLLDLYQIYTYIGGMPSVVANYIKNKDLKQVRENQKKILAMYEQDFSKYTDAPTSLRLKELWRSIPNQCIRRKGSKKFNFSIVMDGVKGREYRLPLSWLEDCGLIIPVYQVDEGKKHPLGLYTTNRVFRLTLLDIGLFSTLLSIFSEKNYFNKNEDTSDIRGILAEQFVAQELFSTLNQNMIYCWSDNKYEIDFLIENSEEIIPVEVKASNIHTSESMKYFCTKYNPHYVVFLSSQIPDMNRKKKCIPIYSAQHMQSFINNYPKYIKDYAKDWDEDDWLEEVSIRGQMLKKVPEKYKTYPVCLTAVRNNANALQYVPESILSKEFLIDVLRGKNTIFPYDSSH
ncbi:MAG: ATP-binding protein [Desulfovibrio sp.]|nr:ATP-binding protein [Desulfovibrio sp.]